MYINKITVEEGFDFFSASLTQANAIEIRFGFQSVQCFIADQFLRPP